MKTLVGWFFSSLDVLWRNLRIFAYRNRSIFELFFIILYSGEQITLILLITLYHDLSSLIISLFAIIVLSTFALHKLLMESRIKLLEQDISSIQTDNRKIVLEAEELYKRYNELQNYVKR